MSFVRRLWALRRDRPLFLVVALLTVGVLLVWPVVDFYLRQLGLATPYGFNDWGAYTGAIARWSQGQPIYVETDAGGFHGSYLYPPVTLLVFYPFATLNFYAGAALFGTLAIVLLLFGLELVARTAGYEPRVADRLLGLVALFGFQPAARNFKWAQIATMLAGFLCLAYYAQERAAGVDPLYAGGRTGGGGSGAGRTVHRLASGALTTVGSAFKLFFATAGAHLLRDGRRLTGALVTAAVLLAISVIVFGVDAHLTYLEVLQWGKGWSDPRPPGTWDVTASFYPFAILGSLALPAKLLLIASVIGLALAARHDHSAVARRATFALGVAAIPLAAPKLASHDLVVVLLPALVLLGLELERPGGHPTLPVLGVLLVHLHSIGLVLLLDPPGWLAVGGLLTDLAPLLQPGLWGTGLLFGLAVYRVGQCARLPGAGRRRSPSP